MNTINHNYHEYKFKSGKTHAARGTVLVGKRRRSDRDGNGKYKLLSTYTCDRHDGYRRFNGITNNFLTLTGWFKKKTNESNR